MPRLLSTVLWSYQPFVMRMNTPWRKQVGNLPFVDTSTFTANEWRTSPLTTARSCSRDRIQPAMIPSEVDTRALDLLRKPIVGHFSFQGRDHYPHVLPVWF